MRRQQMGFWTIGQIVEHEKGIGNQEYNALLGRNKHKESEMPVSGPYESNMGKSCGFQTKIDTTFDTLPVIELGLLTGIIWPCVLALSLYFKLF